MRKRDYICYLTFMIGNIKNEAPIYVNSPNKHTALRTAKRKFYNRFPGFSLRNTKVDVFRVNDT